MRRIFGFLFLCLAGLAGCANARLYPVRGPIAQSAPATVLHGRITGPFNSGTLTIALSDGERCTGHWAQVRDDRAQTPPGAGGPSSPEIRAAWDAIYGEGFYLSHVLGARYYARAVVTGGQDAIFRVEMYRPEVGPNTDLAGTIRGVAVDNQGNVYKLLFR